MRAAVTAASLVVFAVANDSRNMFVPIPATTMNSGRTSAAQLYLSALAPVEYAQYLSKPASVQLTYAEPIAYGKPVEYAKTEAEGSLTTWACAAAVAVLVGAAVATRRPGAVAEPDLEAAAGATFVAALAVAGEEATVATEPPPTSTESEPASPAPRSAAWNPEKLDVPKLPDVPGAKLFQDQFAPEYLRSSPPYLTGDLAGDIGFDPWCLVALAKPTKANAMQYDKSLRTAEARKQKMLSMSPEEQAESVAWMRNAEIKHARLAMLAAAGWPLAELANSGEGSSLRFATNGRAPSLFNGHLLDFWPALLVIFGGFAFLEVTTKDKITDGDFGFDPLGIAFGKPRRFASGPVDKPVDKIPYVKKFPGYGMVGDMEKLKLAELKNGRAAMMAITGFAVSEFFWGKPVTELTPIFF